MEDRDLSGYIKTRLGSLKGSRHNFDFHWQEIVDYILPHRTGIVYRSTPGIKKMDRIYDSTPTHALYLLAAALHGMLTNPANPWFALSCENEAVDDHDAVRGWLDQVQQIIYDTLNGSNWNTQIHESYLDICGFGTANLFIGKDPTRKVFFDNRSLGECYIAENHMGQIDTVYRVYMLTVRQMIQEWGEKAVPQAVIDKQENDPDYEYEIIHAVYPRTDRKMGNKRRDNLPFASVYVMTTLNWILDNGGFEEYPYCNPRWSVMSGEIYGRSPGMIALPDSKMLNKVMETYLRAMQKQLDPPLLVSNDGFMNPIKTVPGGVNMVKATSVQDKLGVFPVPQHIQAGDEMIQRIQGSIRMIFYNDMLQLPQGPDMTATEVLQRVEEKLRILGPVMGRFQDELLAPALVRVFGLLFRMGELPAPPPGHAGAEDQDRVRQPPGEGPAAGPGPRYQQGDGVSPAVHPGHA